METTHSTTEPPQGHNLIWVASEVPLNTFPKSHVVQSVRFTPLKPIRHWLDALKIQDSQMARTVASLIPAQCPFERTVKLFGRPVVHIPPLCKLNPLYDELVALRFRALCYLADECGEDISSYC